LQLLVFPSHAYETLGKSILESYAWGRPVIASDLGSRRELVNTALPAFFIPTATANNSLIPSDFCLTVPI
jgi:glycosyltransferase involved in cell wall biosynthesis